jgi:hypothetical protein
MLAMKGIPMLTIATAMVALAVLAGAAMSAQAIAKAKDYVFTEYAKR